MKRDCLGLRLFAVACFTGASGWVHAETRGALAFSQSLQLAAAAVRLRVRQSLVVQ